MVSRSLGKDRLRDALGEQHAGPRHQFEIGDALLDQGRDVGRELVARAMADAEAAHLVPALTCGRLGDGIGEAHLHVAR